MLRPVLKESMKKLLNQRQSKFISQLLEPISSKSYLEIVRVMMKLQTTSD